MKIAAHLEDLDAVEIGRVSEGMLGTLLPLLEKMNSEVDRRAYGAFSGGEGLSNEAAQALWHEKFALRRIKLRLEQQIKVGRSAGERLEPINRLGD